MENANPQLVADLEFVAERLAIQEDYTAALLEKFLGTPPAYFQGEILKMNGQLVAARNAALEKLKSRQVSQADPNAPAAA